LQRHLLSVGHQVFEPHAGEALGLLAGGLGCRLA
jgi:hypothetical protein